MERLIEFMKGSVVSNLLLLVFLSIGFLGAQNLTLIKNVRVFNGEQVIENTSVLLEGNTIKALGNILGHVDGVIVDGTGKTLIPALSNAHVHIWTPAALKEAASAGVLNVMDMHGVERSQNMLKQLNNNTEYARYYIAGAAATVPEGHGTQYGFPTPTLTKPEEAKDFIRDRLAAGVDYIKIIVEPSKLTLTPKTVAALIKEAHAVDLKTIVHISRVEDAAMVLGHQADGLAHLWMDKEMTTSQMDEIAQRDVFMIPTTLTILKALESNEDLKKNSLTRAQILEQIKMLHDRNITILAGTDPPNLDINYGTDLYKEMALFTEAGLSNEEAIKTATSNIAKSFGLKNKGLIKPGYTADLLLLDGNPLTDITQLSSVIQIWKDGKTLK